MQIYPLLHTLILVYLTINVCTFVYYSVTLLIENINV